MRCTQANCHHPALQFCDSCGADRCASHARMCEDCGKTHCISFDVSSYALCSAMHECGLPDDKLTSEIKTLVDMVFEEYDKNVRFN